MVVMLKNVMILLTKKLTLFHCVQIATIPIIQMRFMWIVISVRQNKQPKQKHRQMPVFFIFALRNSPCI